jgi:hypothetical protein
MAIKEAINFNVDPYYDDFDPSKNFHRILFKPGSAVQARELTQSQSILQNQISNFADHIFSQNTPVTGGKVTTNLNCTYLKLQPQYQNVDIVVSDFLNKEITDDTGTVRAKVVAYREGSLIDSNLPPTIIINYYSGAQFTDGMTVSCVDGSSTVALTIGVAGGTTCSGKASTASISQGVFYIVNGYSNSSTPNPDGSYSKYSIGNFVSVLPQTTILDAYSNTPSYRVGLDIAENIVTYLGDTSLLDPAVGASNYQAPGADRYQITLSLVSKPLKLGDDDSFVELLRIENGLIVKQVDGTVYSVIDDYFAKRDYESNGDYVVNEFRITPVTNADESKFDLRLGKGVAYVHGYRIENQSDLLLENDRARTTDSYENNPVFFDYGSYLIVNRINGKFDITTMPKIDLHCVTSSNIYSANATTYNSTLVGTAYIRNLQFESSTSDSDTSTYTYKAYVTDISTTTLNGTAASGSATTIQFLDTNGTFSNVANAYYGSTITITGGASTGDRRTVVSYNGATKTATVDTPFTVAVDSSSNFSFAFKVKDVDSFITKNSSGSIIATAQIANAGKTNGLVTGDTILTNPKVPELVFPIGYQYVANISNSDYNSSKVFRSKTLTNVSGTATLAITIPSGTPQVFTGTGQLSSDVAKQNFIVINQSTGSILDFSTSGNTITISSDKKTATLRSTTHASGTVVDVIADVSISNADDSTTILKAKNLVTGNVTVASTSGVSNTINSSTYIDLTKGQVYIKHAAIGKINSLYVSDVKRIVKVVNSRNPAVTVTSAMVIDAAYDITSLFVLNNGQKDTMYDHASADLVAGASIPDGNILVIFDYYAHTGGDGYFSVNSYIPGSSGGVSTSPEDYQSIPTYTSKGGTVYRLADCVDFRPVRKSAQAEMEFEYTGNPSSDDTGILIPQPLSEYTSDYNYYLARKDKLVLTKDKEFKIIKGTPSTDPIFPTEPDGSLVLANLTLDPYTAYIPGEATGQVDANLSIEKVLHKNWIKRDITDLQTRVNNLEYYSALSLLETNAQSLQVQDVNGLNRFKNGILVDDFSSYSTADTANPDFQANVNTRKKRLGPLNIVENFALQNPVVLNSLGTLNKTNYFSVSSIGGTQTNIFTLPYTTANVIVQPIATSTVSVNPFAVAVAQGIVSLNPPMDNWVDNNQAPAILVTDPSLKVYQQTNGVNLLNSGDFATIPGTSESTSTVTTGRGFIATTTDTYASQLGNVTKAGYSQVSSTVGSNNGYLTNIAVLPYIRPQQIIVRAKGLLINSEVSCWFDGIKANDYMTSPNTIELVNVGGKFKENDIVGFYTANKFNPLGRVVGMYNYPDSTSARLYISALLGAQKSTTTSIIQNAVFDSAGQYNAAASNTAYGFINESASVTPLHTSGVITGVGGKYNPAGGGAESNIYKIQSANDWGTFLNQYGVWGDLSKSGTFDLTFVVDVQEAGTYTFVMSASGTGTLRVGGTSAANNVIVHSAGPRTTTSNTKYLTVGSHTIRVYATTTAGSPGAVAVVGKNSAGEIIYQSTSPPASSYNDVAQQIVMPKGGAWFTGVTKLALDANASDVNDYYVGAKLAIQSKYCYSYTVQSATYVPPPPPPSSGGRCFTKDTLILMADGTEKKIKDVKVGDVVFNHNKKMLNVVMFVEETLDSTFMELYSPNKKLKPFATINHPLYIDGQLSCPISKEIMNLYPWLGHINQMDDAIRTPAKGDMVYNLWVDGDGTYIVNGYGTTSIVGDGGVLRLNYENGTFTKQAISDTLVEVTSLGKYITYGGYILNKLCGDMNLSIGKYLIGRSFKDNKSPLTKKFLLATFNIVGKIACIINNK